MRRTKRGIILITVAILLIGAIGHGIYRYYQLGGMNVPIIISTQYSNEPANIEVYIDNRLIFKDKDLLSLYTGIDTHTSFGIHQLKVIVDGTTFTNMFFVFPVCYIYIEIQQNNKYREDNSDEYWVWIDFSMYPTAIL